MRAIALFVIAAHLLVGLSISFWEQNAPRLPQKKGEFVVKTVKLNAAKKEVLVTESAQASPVIPQKKPEVIKKPAAPKKAKAAIFTNSSKDSVERGKAVAGRISDEFVKVAAKADAKLKPEPKPKANWVGAAKEKIGKITAMKDNASTKLIAAPALIENLESEFSLQEMGYRDELMHRLKESLKLPQYGEVKIQLMIERSGKIVSIKVLTFQSVENAEYIKKNLSKVQMPEFGACFQGLATHEFTVVLSNE